MGRRDYAGAQSLLAQLPATMQRQAAAPVAPDHRGAPPRRPAAARPARPGADRRRHARKPGDRPQHACRRQMIRLATWIVVSLLLTALIAWLVSPAPAPR